MFNIENWHIDDPYPHMHLDKIEPLSARAWSFLSRSKEKGVVQQGFLNVVGAIDMMSGMEYHHTNFCNIIREAAVLPSLHPRSSAKKRLLTHEAVAYLNRMGQFYHFASSQFVTGRVSDWESMISTIKKYKKFRDKHSAHRSIDKPRPEDNPHFQQVHAWSFSSLGGCLFAPKPGREFTLSKDNIVNPRRMWTDSYLCCQMIGGKKNETLNLSIEREHPVFISEAHSLVENLLSME
jgi:hypothetical protein